MDKKIKIEQIVVRSDRLIVVVRVNTDCPRTSPEIAARVVERFPDALSHSCMNAMGPTFGHVIENTSIAHLLEHLVIDLQASEYTRAHGGENNMRAHPSCNGSPKHSAPPLLTGITQWIDEDAGLAQVQVSMVSDICAVRALTQACDFINSLQLSGNR